MAERLPIPTAPPEVPLERLRRNRNLRRAFIVGLAIFLALGLLNVFGVKTSEVSASGGGYELSVTYSSVTRPGLATPWSVEIALPSPAPQTVTLATTASYFDIFDENGLDPEPVDSVNDGERILWTFATPPDSDRMTVSFDARTEPGVQFKRAKATTELVDGPATIVAVDYRTLVMP